MPAEWEKHDATWIAWPHHEPDWPGKLAPIPWVYAEIVRALSDYDRVEILCHDESVAENARTLLAAHGVNPTRYGIHLVGSDRVWLRDSAPTGTVRADGKLELVNWGFNGWAKYDNYKEGCADRQGDRAHHRIAANRPEASRQRRDADSRGRRDRGERLGSHSRDRRVAAHGRPGSQSRDDVERLRACVCRVSRRERHDLARRGSGRRRHPRSRRRHRALQLARHGDSGVRAGFRPTRITRGRSTIFAASSSQETRRRFESSRSPSPGP